VKACTDVGHGFHASHDLPIDDEELNPPVISDVDLSKLTDGKTILLQFEVVDDTGVGAVSAGAKLMVTNTSPCLDFQIPFQAAFCSGSRFAQNCVVSIEGSSMWVSGNICYAILATDRFGNEARVQGSWRVRDSCTSFDEGETCDDRDPCTVQDTCSGAKCRGLPKPCDPPPKHCTFNGLAWYSGGACEPATGLCQYVSDEMKCPCADGRCLSCEGSRCVDQGWMGGVHCDGDGCLVSCEQADLGCPVDRTVECCRSGRCSPETLQCCSNESDPCVVNGWTSGTHCSGDTSVTCSVNLSGCPYQKNYSDCSEGCDSATGFCNCGWNMCETKGWSSGDHCYDANTLVTCTKPATCILTSASKNCPYGCDGSTNKCSCDPSDFCTGKESGKFYCNGTDSISCSYNATVGCVYVNGLTGCTSGCNPSTGKCIP